MEKVKVTGQYEESPSQETGTSVLDPGTNVHIRRSKINSSKSKDSVLFVYIFDGFTCKGCYRLASMSFS